MEADMSSVTAGSLLVSAVMGLVMAAPSVSVNLVVPQVAPACALITTEEAATVLHITAAEAKSSDTPEMAKRGESRCVFGPTKGFGDVVTVLLETGIDPLDQKSLTELATSMGIGDTAKPIEGFGVFAAAMEDMPTIVAQKGTAVVLVSAPTMEGTKDLMAEAVARVH
jgi:hypothetical protein